MTPNSYRSFLAKLPDKGRRIEELYERILNELRQKDEIEMAAELFSELNISAKGAKFVTNLEWSGEVRPLAQEEDVHVEVEEETDPLKILAQARVKQKIVKVEKPEESLITPEDLKDIERLKSLNLSSESTTSQLDTHATYLCDKENLPNTVRPKFKPYQTTRSNVHDPEKEVLKVFKYKEITAATPPLLKYPGTKMLTLQDSLELQMAKDKEMKVRMGIGDGNFHVIYLYTPLYLQETQQREAELRLAEKAAKTKSRDFVAKDMSEFFKSYRVVNESSDEEEVEETTDEEYDSAEEVLDIDAQEEKCGVNFTIQE